MYEVFGKGVIEHCRQKAATNLKDMAQEIIKEQIWIKGSLKCNRRESQVSIY